MKNIPVYLLVVCGLFMCPSAQADAEPKLYTPKPGTPVRKAICDAMRKYVRQTNHVNSKLNFLWKIDELKLLGNYAVFHGYAVNPDGSYLEDDSAIGDCVQMTFLRKNKDGWWVISDLTRGDVPSDEEMKQIRGTFPAEIPTALIPDFWRKKLR